VVDGTGLENRHTRKSIGGSNPSLSATQSGVQRNPAFTSPPKYTNIARFRDFFSINRTGENGLLISEQPSTRSFLRCGDGQSDSLYPPWRRAMTNRMIGGSLGCLIGRQPHKKRRAEVNFEIQLPLILLHHLDLARSTMQAPSQECFPEAGGAVAFNGITPIFSALRWKRFSR
jgi:hypothetical protein